MSLSQLTATAGLTRMPAARARPSRARDVTRTRRIPRRRYAWSTSLFDGRGNSREHQLPVMSDAPHERRRHLDERGRQHVGQDQRPRSRHRFRPAACQLQPLVERVDARVLRGDAQRLVVDIDARARGTPIISAPSASTPDPVPTSSTASGGAICTASSSASRHSAVVGWSPVPNAAASTSLRAPGSASV